MGLPKMKAEPSIAGVVTGAVRVWLRTESLAAFVLSALLYARLGQKWWIFAALFLAPDLSMLGYLFTPRIGAACYNLVHSYFAPLALAAAALTTNHPAILPFVCIWTAHIALDRALGYGQKYPDAFRHTHLGLLGKISG
jgi:hypothetical protein